MGTNTIPTAADGTAIPASDHNSVQEAMANDIVPRNTSGVPTANQGDLGTSTYPFKGAEITTGYFFAGQIMPMHTFNGLLSPGHGWMKCDGRVVNETNYNAEHGAGTWATYVGSSPITSRNLPDLTGEKYLQGVASTTDDGTVAMPIYGNSTNEISVGDHSHFMGQHNHQWYVGRDATTDDQTYNSGGSAVTVPAGTAKTGGGAVHIPRNNGTGTGVGDSFTSDSGGSTLTGLGGTFTRSIRPASIRVVFYMRIK